MNEEGEGKEKARVGRGIYIEEERNIQAVCCSIKSANNSDQFERGC